MSDENMSADAMLALARDHDAGVDIDSQPAEQTQNNNESASVEQESSNEVTASKETDGGEQEVSAKSEPESKAKQKEEKPKDQKSNSKFAQEQQRKAKTWEQINAEKEAIKAEREAVKREREEWSRQREQSTAAESNSFRDDKGYTAEDYEAAAKEFDADGDTQLAKAARAKADGVRKATVELLQRVPFLTAMPDGLVHAVELMKLQDTAGRSQSLESENKALKEQLSKLQQKTAIGKSVPAGQLKTEEKDFSRLSMKEQRDALMRASREFDREGN